MNAELTKYDVTLFGISRDSLASHDNFITKYDLPFILLSDPDTEIMKAYGAFGEKKMYGKSVQGVIRSTVLIDQEGLVLKHWAKIAKPADHPGKVLEYLENMKKT